MLFANVASAQVTGIAYADPTEVVLKTKALEAAYGQVNSTFAANFQLIDQRAKEANELQQQLLKQFDANADKQIDDAELAKLDAAKSPLKDQISAKNAEAQKLQEPIVRGQMFALENILLKYNAAQTQVVTAKKVNILLSPEAIVYAPAAANISPDITLALDTTVPTVSITPPANWGPAQDTQAIYKQIQQILAVQARNTAIRNAQAAQKGAAPAPGTAPKPGAPVPPAKPQTR